MSYIVIAVIAITILVLVLAFTTGRFSALFGATTEIEKETVSQARLVALQSKCATLCLQAQNLDEEGQATSLYCIADQIAEIEGDQYCWSTGVGQINYNCEGVTCPIPLT